MGVSSTALVDIATMSRLGFPQMLKQRGSNSADLLCDITYGTPPLNTISYSKINMPRFWRFLPGPPSVESRSPALGGGAIENEGSHSTASSSPPSSSSSSPSSSSMHLNTKFGSFWRHEEREGGATV